MNSVLLSSKGAMRVISCLGQVNSAVGECGGCLRVDLLFLLTSKDLRAEIYLVSNQVSQSYLNTDWVASDGCQPGLNGGPDDPQQAR
ncbi:hypothetical protein Zmor_017785 [Zophobas morio]|uniref:Uncharacterized protein n=1 Tax=Zophobas morio TaxID=2755281 RepID=A0AA38MCI1_9CUCU|nr:hypothetical protein Zmor_017785 [Zophobas morio]